MPGSATFLLRDPDEFRMAMPELGVNLVVTGPGVFEAQLNRVKLKHTLLLSCDENLPRVAHVSLDSHSTCLLFPTREGTPLRASGVDCAFGDVLFCGQGRRLYTRTTGPVSWGCILFKSGRAHRTGSLNLGQDAERPGSGWVTRPARPQIRRLLRLHRQAAQSWLRSPRSTADTGSAAELEQLLMEAARGCWAFVQGRKIAAFDQSRHDVMNRFQDIVQASPNGLVDRAELDANLGISGRTLRYYCQQHLGMGPGRYLRLNRLHLVRAALLRADLAGPTVKEIASQYGFHEAGRFSIAYRALYGESPFVALHRTPASPSGSDDPHPPDFCVKTA